MLAGDVSTILDWRGQVVAGVVAIVVAIISALQRSKMNRNIGNSNGSGDIATMTERTLLAVGRIEGHLDSLSSSHRELVASHAEHVADDKVMFEAIHGQLSDSASRLASIESKADEVKRVAADIAADIATERSSTGDSPTG